MFLSRLLTSAKTRYWSTKLEMVELVWMFQKTHYLIKVTKTFIIVYINHKTFLKIVKQTKLSISSIDKFNFWLVCISDYIQRFSLVIKYKSGKHYIISDVFSRLEEKGKKVLDN